MFFLIDKYTFAVRTKIIAQKICKVTFLTGPEKRGALSIVISFLSLIFRTAKHQALWLNYAKCFKGKLKGTIKLGEFRFRTGTQLKIGFQMKPIVE